MIAKIGQGGLYLTEENLSVNRVHYYLNVKFYMFYKVLYFQLFLEFWLSSVLLPDDLLHGVLLRGVL